MRALERPTEEQLLMFMAVNRELKKRTRDVLTDDERALIVASFVENYDFTNSALSHKSASGWANYLVATLKIPTQSAPTIKGKKKTPVYAHL